MKKIFSFLLVLNIILLVGCSSNKTENEIIKLNEILEKNEFDNFLEYTKSNYMYRDIFDDLTTDGNFKNDLIKINNSFLNNIKIEILETNELEDTIIIKTNVKYTNNFNIYLKYRSFINNHLKDSNIDTLKKEKYDEYFKEIENSEIESTNLDFKIKKIGSKYNIINIDEFYDIVFSFDTVE